jgi:FXSXX-COOH protein
MTPSGSTFLTTDLVRVADLPLDELIALRDAGDTALDHSLRRVVAQTRSGEREGVAAFNAAPLRRS